MPGWDDVQSVAVETDDQEDDLGKLPSTNPTAGDVIPPWG